MTHQNTFKHVDVVESLLPAGCSNAIVRSLEVALEASRVQDLRSMAEQRRVFGQERFNGMMWIRSRNAACDSIGNTLASSARSSQEFVRRTDVARQMTNTIDRDSRFWQQLLQSIRAGLLVWCELRGDRMLGQPFVKIGNGTDVWRPEREERRAGAEEQPNTTK